MSIQQLNINQILQILQLSNIGKPTHKKRKKCYCWWV